MRVLAEAGLRLLALKFRKGEISVEQVILIVLALFVLLVAIGVYNAMQKRNVSALENILWPSP